MFWQMFLKECEKKGISPNPAAKEMKIASATLTKWKNGTIPGTKNLEKVASYFGVTTDYLLGKSSFRTLDEAADAFEVTADKAVEQMSDWLESHGYELTCDESDNGSGVTWYISNQGKTIYFEDNDFKVECVNLAELAKNPVDVLYADWITRQMKGTSLSEDEQDLLNIFHSLNRRAVHELMAKAYELYDRAQKEKTDSQKESAV